MGLWPMCFLLITIIHLEREKYSVYGVNALGDERNVGTVLFDKSYSHNHCWTNEEFVILSSRMMFQDLLPKSEELNTKTDQYVADLLNYFYICLKYVCKYSVGKTKHLMLKSLADAMGGYLNSYAVPITKISFYAGSIKYRNAKKIFDLLSELQNFLHSNGEGWRKPSDMAMFINVTPIVVSTKGASEACNKLIINYTVRVPNERNNRRRPRRRRRQRGCRSRENSHAIPRFDTGGNSADLPYQETFNIFLPYLDNKVNPNSIALPFKDHALWSLYEEESVAILSRYYEICVNCITSKENFQEILLDFNKDFYKWLLQSVYPRLNDDKWYPAFGEVLRIIAFLKDRVGDGKYVPFEPPEEVIITTPKLVNDVDETSNLGTTELIIIAIASALLVWLLVGISLICYRYLRKHSDECSPCESPKTSNLATLYRNRDYCYLDTCPSMNSRKSVSEKIKQWWSEKFRSRSGCVDGTAEPQRCMTNINCKSRESLCTKASRRSYKRRKKKIRPICVSASPSSSPCEHYSNKKFHYSSDISSSNSDSSYR